MAAASIAAATRPFRPTGRRWVILCESVRFRRGLRTGTGNCPLLDQSDANDSGQNEKEDRENL